MLVSARPTGGLLAGDWVGAAVLCRRSAFVWVQDQVRTPSLRRSRVAQALAFGGKGEKGGEFLDNAEEIP